MRVLKNTICEFCNKKRKWVASNSFHGFYCPNCLRLSRAEDLECLHEIETARKREGGGDG